MYPRTKQTEYILNEDNRIKEKLMDLSMKRFNDNDMMQDASVINPNVQEASMDVLSKVRKAVDDFIYDFYETIAPDAFSINDWDSVYHNSVNLGHKFNRIASFIGVPGIDTVTKKKAEIMISEIDGPLNKFLQDSKAYVKSDPEFNKMVTIYQEMCKLIIRKINEKEYSFITMPEIKHIFDEAHEGKEYNMLYIRDEDDNYIANMQQLDDEGFDDKQTQTQLQQQEQPQEETEGEETEGEETEGEGEDTSSEEPPTPPTPKQKRLTRQEIAIMRRRLGIDSDSDESINDVFMGQGKGKMKKQLVRLLKRKIDEDICEPYNDMADDHYNDNVHVDVSYQ